MASHQPNVQDVLPHGPAVRRHQLSLATATIAGIAALKILAGLLLITPLVPAGMNQSNLGGQFAFRSLPWFLPGIVLLLANGRQFRTASLGVAMLLFASRNAGGAVGLLVGSLPGSDWIINVAPVVLVPYYFGRFLLEFPQPRTGPSARWLVAATRLAAVVGSVQFVVLLSRGVTLGWQQPFWYQLILGTIDSRVVPVTTFGLSLLVLALSFERLRGLLPQDRRRHQRLFVGWAVLMVPLSFWVIQYVLAADGSSISSCRSR